MRERGLNNRYISIYWRTTQVFCSSSTTGYKEALGILDVIIAIYILLFGYAFSIVVLCMEILLARSKVEIVQTETKFT